MYFHYLPILISIVLCAVVSLCWVPVWCNSLLSISWFCPRKLELESSPPSCCSVVVAHWASLIIKKILWSFAVVPLCVVRWYPSWVLRCGVWDWGGNLWRFLNLVRCFLRVTVSLLCRLQAVSKIDVSIFPNLINEGRRNCSALWPVQQRNRDSQETCYQI